MVETVMYVPGTLVYGNNFLPFLTKSDLAVNSFSGVLWKKNEQV